MERGLEGLVVVAFESRRAAEMAELIRRHGGTPVVAPSMREIPLEQNAMALAFLDRLEQRAIDMILFLTGVGTRALIDVLSPRCSAAHFADLVRSVTVVARGPKPLGALRALDIVPQIVVPEPNTWREVLAALDAQGSIRNRTIAIQEYGASNPALIAGLEARGARVERVPVYRWALPADVGPLRAAVARVAKRDCSIALFTSATQVDHVMQVATELHLDSAIRIAAKDIVVASIGPVCDEALRRHGLPVDLDPPHPRMGHLVSTVAQHARALLAAKQGQVTH